MGSREGVQTVLLSTEESGVRLWRARINPREIGILLPNNQRQHRALHIQKDVLPYALC